MRRLLATVIVLAVFAALMQVSVGALFTDTAAVPANQFTAGTLDISTSPTSALVTFSNMAPGDQVTAPITVQNAGNLALRYAITGTTTENVLAAQLDLTIKSGVTTCTTGGFAASGTILYGPNDLGTTTTVDLVGNPAQGANAGDRALAASASEVLCFNVILPLTTGNSFQGLTTTATFNFVAEQTANN